MKIFLSGKVDRKYGDWRTALVGEKWGLDVKNPTPNWVIRLHNALTDYDWGERWVPWPGHVKVLGLHEYVGPFRVEFEYETESKYAGDFHGQEVPGQHGMPDDCFREKIAESCRHAINRADFVFAYLNSPDCFGTLVEIGYARALGKYTHLVISPDASWDWGDYWFAAEFANEVADYCSFGDSEPREWIRRRFEEALVEWSATITLANRAVQEGQPDAVTTLASIERWTSDPRARNEAGKLLRKVKS